MEWFRVLALLKGVIFCKVFIHWDILALMAGEYLIQRNGNKHLGFLFERHQYLLIFWQYLRIFCSLSWYCFFIKCLFMKTSEGPNPVSCSWFLESWIGYFLKLKFPPFLTIGSWPLANQPVCSGVFSVYSDVFVGLKCLYCCRGFCRAVQSCSSVFSVSCVPWSWSHTLGAHLSPGSPCSPSELPPRAASSLEWEHSPPAAALALPFQEPSICKLANFCTKLHFISLMLYWIFHIFPWEQWFIFLVKII